MDDCRLACLRQGIELLQVDVADLASIKGLGEYGGAPQQAAERRRELEGAQALGRLEGLGEPWGEVGLGTCGLGEAEDDVDELEAR